MQLYKFKPPAYRKVTFFQRLLTECRFSEVVNKPNSLLFCCPDLAEQKLTALLQNFQGKSQNFFNFFFDLVLAGFIEMRKSLCGLESRQTRRRRI